MATFRNATQAKVIVNDEFGLPVSFEPGETKGGVSNYLERYTSAYQSGEDILLVRVGSLDTTVLDGTDLPSPVIEEENMAVRPAAPNSATQGLNTQIGGVRTSDIPAGFIDTTNTSTRLRRVGFNTELDLEARQIDTRYLSIKPIALLAQPDNQTFALAALDQGGGSNTRAFTITNNPVEVNGRRATATDAAHSVYGSLLTEGQYYTAFGTVSFDDAGGGGALESIVGFVISGTTVTLTDATLGGNLTSLAGAFVASTGVLTWTRTGGASGDEIGMTIYFSTAVTSASEANAVFGPSGSNPGEVRGTYEVGSGSGTPGLLTFTENGIFEVKAGGNAFVAYS